MAARDQTPNTWTYGTRATERADPQQATGLSFGDVDHSDDRGGRE